MQAIDNNDEAQEINNMLNLEPIESKAGSFVFDAKIMGAPGFTLFKVMHKQHLVGYIQCCVNESGYDGNKHLEITKLYIFQNSQGKGYGAEAVNRILEVASDEGISSVGAEHLDRRAFDFWSKTKLSYNLDTDRFELHNN
ncbi:GNAT family N-acetyltransferase [Serratia fonticola]|uniref:GNAT family N-acetyltransferase n=1 Tax=Serratia fonticola TaxID=47917 RepID=UPI0021BA75EF|nr:GNAT family N-acetyltransferase [Serratia fonticola]